jgi:hypothetical protein
MSENFFGVATPVAGPPSGSIDQDRRQEVTERETVKQSARDARLATLRGAIGSASTSFADLRLRRITWQDIEGGFTTIEKVFAGSDPGDASDPTEEDPLAGNEANQISLEISTQEQPILSIPRYRDAVTITAEERTALAKVINGDIDAESAIESDLGLEVLEKIKNGVEAVYIPTVTLRERGTFTGTNNFNLDAVGKRITGGLPGGMPPTFGSGQNFLYAGLNQTAFGTDRFEFERVFLGSGFGGWDPDIYDSTSIGPSP